MIKGLKICEECQDEYKGEGCEWGCEAWYCYLLNHEEEW